MVDIARFQSAAVLVDEYKALGIALDNLERGGRIVAMSIAGPVPELPEGAPEPPPDPGATVPTRSIDYPPQMVTAIRAALEQRRGEIAQELTDLGVVFEAR